MWKSTLQGVFSFGQRRNQALTLLIPVKITVKFFDSRDPTLHILIASNKTQNKSTNVNTVGTQNAQHIAEGTLTRMSVSDFLGLVNGSEQFTKRMPNFGIGSADSESTLLHAANPESKGQSLTGRLLYIEALMRKAEREGNLYTQRLLQREIEKAQRNSRLGGIDASTPMPTIYADRISKYDALEDYSDEIDFDNLNVDLENATDGDTIEDDDIVIGKSLGAKAKNYDIMDFETGEIYQFTEGTRIQNVEVFAGKGTNDEYHKAYKMARKYGGQISDWQHVKGFGWVSTPDGDGYAEVHWSQCKGIGKHEFFIKRWIDR